MSAIQTIKRYIKTTPFYWAYLMVYRAATGHENPWMMFRQDHNPMVLALWNSFMLRPAPFAIWYQLRYARHQRKGQPVRVLDPADNTGGSQVEFKVLPYNLEKMLKVSRYRTERLMTVLRCVRNFNPATAKLLSIGPRNEAELLLMRLYGFRFENLIGIDLFSYSPLIQVMDMHAMTFADNSFDVVYSSYTIRYSPDIRRVCAEISRVARPGGLIALNFTALTDPEMEKTDLSVDRLAGGTDEILGHFGDSVGEVIWRDAHVPHDNDGQVADRQHCSLIFRLSA